MSLVKSMLTKALGVGKAVSDDDLAQINAFAHVPLTADQIYTRTYLIAHNGIDRDQERFSEDLLEDFAKTLPGSGFFVEGHPSWSKNGPGRGLWYRAWTEDTTKERFHELTGEDILLPAGKTPKVLFGKSYLLKLDSNEDTLKHIDAGIYRFVSIGFNAPRSSVTDGLGNHIYGEYRPTGEALETSLVWRGAQPGASAMKGAAGPPERPGDDVKGDSIPMIEKLIAALGARFGKTFTADRLADDIIALVNEKDTQLAAKDQEIASLKAAAEDGKAYRKSLVEDTIRFGALIGEIKTDADSQKKEEEYLMTVPIDRLKAMQERVRKAAYEKVPSAFEIPLQDQTDRDRKNAATDGNVEEAAKMIASASPKPQ